MGRRCNRRLVKLDEDKPPVQGLATVQGAFSYASSFPVVIWCIFSRAALGFRS